MALHEQAVGKSDEWYTPHYVFLAMGEMFDLEVAAPDGHACPSCAYAREQITQASLEQPWHGFIWMNPPFGGRNGIAPWLNKFFLHGSGVALTPDRTSAPWWQAAAKRADALLFVAPKIKFIPGPGVIASSPAQGTTLMAAGERGVQALLRAERIGLGIVKR